MDSAPVEVAELLDGVKGAVTGGGRDEAMLSSLRAVCSFTGWPLGHAYLRVADRLEPTNLWHDQDPARFAAFRATTLATRLKAGEGLPGRVLYSGAPAWITDVNADPNFPRQHGGAASELGSAFAFPVRWNGQVVAVLEFFSDGIERPTEGLMEFVERVSAELSRAFQDA